MDVQIDGIKIFYKRFDGETIPTILLHGWGGGTSVMQTIYDGLVIENKSVISLDFPLFGGSDDPPLYYTIYDYAKLISKFIERLQLDKVNIIAHSFGGRVALILAQNETKIQKLVLTGGAGLKPRRKLSYYIKVFKHKICKRFGFKDKQGGSADYKALKDEHKPIFIRVVNTHLNYTLQNIHIPTLLIWGGKDDQTPLYMAKTIKKTIKNCQIYIIDNASHYAFLDSVHEFNAVMNSFL